MPKVETHLHLEGSIQPATLLEIARRNQVEIPARDVAGVEQLFKYQSFHEFLTVFMALARVLVRGEDFEQIAYELGHHLADQQVRYAEVMISPRQHSYRGIDLNEVVQGAAAGFAKAQRERGIGVNLAFDYGRQFGTEEAWPLLECAIGNQHNTLVAWSIGGDERHFPPEPFAELFAAAKQAGLHVMAHAGEVVGPASVWGAVDVLGAERIGHGVRSVDDPALLTHLRERGVVLDVCPTSNLRTGAVASLAAHPFRRLFNAGLTLTVNTDDPVFFATTLNDEYRLLAGSFGFTAEELTTLALNAAHASFLPDEQRAMLSGQMQSDIAALRAELDL
ncbi:MAG: adenosine deaminase [Roseiflexaceae bacterium]|nr:adenosine deaminase [Roseiflexaceae bacterium]